MDISIDRTKNMFLVKHLMTHPDVWERACEDGWEKEDYTPSREDIWLVYKADNKIVGVCGVEAFNGVTLVIHPYLFKSERKLGREFIRETLLWLIKNAKRKIEKVIALIPECYKTVYNCAIKCGFTEEGRLRKQYKKNGCLLDQWYMGITNKEILKGL